MEQRASARAAAVTAALQSIALPDIVDREDLSRAMRLPAAEVELLITSPGFPGRFIGDRWYCAREALVQYLWGIPAFKGGPSEGRPWA